MQDEDKISGMVRRLIAIGKDLEKAGYPLSIGTGPKRRINKEAVKMFIELSKKQPYEEITSEVLLKKLLTKLHPISKQPEEREDIEKQERSNTEKSKTSSAEKLEKELDAAISHLRGRNNIDSDVNDLRILEDMAKISSLASSLSAKGSKDVSKANIAISNYSLTTGGAPLEGAVRRQALKTNTESIADAVRYHLDQPNNQTILSDISGLPTTAEAKAAKARQNQKYSESLEYVRGMERMRKERK